MPLRVRLAVLVAAVVAFLVTAGGAMFVVQLQAGLDASQDAALRVRADALIERVSPDGNSNFQDSGGTGVLPPTEALAQVVDSRGALSEYSDGTRGRPLLSGKEIARARVRPLSATSSMIGSSVRVLAVPVPASGRPAVVVVVATSRALTEAAVSRVRSGFLLGGLLAVVVCGSGAWLLAGAALRPVERMRRQAADISAGDGGARLAVPGTRDEVARLGTTMNELLDRLQRALSQQRDFVADAGHELRTPLTALRAELELAGRPGRSREELSAAVARAAQDADRLVRLAENLLVLARASDGAGAFLRRSPVRLDRLIAEAEQGVAARVDLSAVRLITQGMRPALVDADPDRLRQVLDNLVSNAVRFTAAGGAITVRMLPPNPAQGTTTFEVLDDGPGFPEAFLPYAFERFRRADEARTEDGGVGLGLAIVASLVRAHGGSVTAENRRGAGACVRVALPTMTAPAEPHRRSVTVAASRRP